MKYTTLDHTDIKVSKICLGTMTWGEQNTESDGHEQMDYALEMGINFFDTAEMYSVPGRPETQGSTERYIGSWFHKTGNRDKVVLASKVTGPSRGLKHVRDTLDFSKEQIHLALEGSLKRLQTDYIDLYQLHWPERKANFFSTLGFVHDESDEWEDNFLSILHTMNGLIQEGKIRHFGISNETAWGMMHFVHLAKKHNLPQPISIQNAYSLLSRSFEVGCAEVSIREGVGLLAYSPLAFGMLSGKYHRGDNPKNPNYRINRYKQYARYSHPSSLEATRRYIEIADNFGVSVTQMALAFINTRPFVTANIIGATNMTQLKENIDSIHLDFTDEMLKEIEKVHRDISNPAF